MSLSARELFEGLTTTTDTAPSPTFADLLQQVYTDRFTGTLILHCAEGVPRKVEFPTQVIPGRQVTLTKGGS